MNGKVIKSKKLQIIHLKL